MISGITNFDYTKAVLRYDNGQGDVREWQILPYDEKPDHRVYRFEPANTVSGTNVRMQFIRDDGTVATEDSFLIADRLDEKLTMKVYGEGIDENYVTLVYDGTAYGIISGPGELTVRSTASPTFFTITDDSGSILRKCLEPARRVPPSIPLTKAASRRMPLKSPFCLTTSLRRGTTMR